MIKPRIRLVAHVACGGNCRHISHIIKYEIHRVNSLFLQLVVETSSYIALYFPVSTVYLNPEWIGSVCSYWVVLRCQQLPAGKFKTAFYVTHTVRFLIFNKLTNKCKKVKQSHYRSGQVLRVPGG